MAATPGRFCEAMVTTNKGSARLVRAASVNTGAVNTGTASVSVSEPALNWPRRTTKATDTTSVITTA